MNPLKYLVIASKNKHKIDEISDLLESFPLDVKSLSDFGDIPEVLEDGDSFEINAKKKAREYANMTGMAVLADDSGLCVDALDGAPGILSARFAGANCNDEENNKKLMASLKGLPLEKRKAAYHCALACYIPDTKKYILTVGICPGTIALEIQGDGGFGYDPYFIPDGYDKTFGILPPQIKQKISHRAKALALFKKEFMKNYE